MGKVEDSRKAVFFILIYPTGYPIKSIRFAPK